MSEGSPKTALTARALLADLCAVSGLGLLSYGAYLIYPPAGLIVPGAGLLAAGIIGALKGGG